jgi:uncharacterized membrane protein HdeD (DUF308 family)
MKQTLLRIPQFLPSVAIVSAVLYLTLYPKPFHDYEFRLFEHTDKVVHGIMMCSVYVVLAFDIIRRRQQLELLSPSLIWWLFFGVSAFGGIIELAQEAMACGRGCDVWDFVADIIGAVIGLLLVKRHSRHVVAWLLDD